MTISASLVKELREKTSAGMMDCKKALQESAGDMEKAIIWLREKGISRAAKKAGRVTAEGVVCVQLNEARTQGAMVEINCETDFVARGDAFLEFANEVAKAALTANANDIEALETATLSDGRAVKDNLTDVIAKLGENMQLRRVVTVSAPSGVVSGYVHGGGKIGVLVALDGAQDDTAHEAAKDVAMHTAASAPRYLDPDGVDPAEIEQEKAIARKKLADENKPDNIIEKILVGQVSKFFKEICLLEQPFVKEPKKSVKQFVSEQNKDLKVATFARFQLGEGIEKQEANFAEEVAAAAKH